MHAPPPLPLSPGVRRALGVGVLSLAAAGAGFLATAHAEAAPAKHSKQCAASAQRTPSPAGDLVVYRRCDGGTHAQIVRQVPPPRVAPPKLPAAVQKVLPKPAAKAPAKKVKARPAGHINVLDVQVSRKGKVTRLASDFGPQAPPTIVAGENKVVVGKQDRWGWNIAGTTPGAKATKNDRQGVHVPRFVTNPKPTPNLIPGRTGGSGQGLPQNPNPNQVPIYYEPEQPAYIEPEQPPQTTPQPQASGSPRPPATGTPKQDKEPVTPPAPKPQAPVTPARTPSDPSEVEVTLG